MSTIALIGGDGSGKSTIAKMLLHDFPLPLKCVYMGVSTESSNFALPWSRLILRLKRMSYRQQAKQRGISDPTFLTTHHIEHRRRKGGRLRAVLRLFNRQAEAWYRQLIAWGFQLRGYHVLYDRHVLFDMAPGASLLNLNKRSLSDRIQYWILSHAFPKPDLVVFLDAPAEVMYARKGEESIERLEKQRLRYLKQGEQFSNFVRVDASQPIESVYNEVHQSIIAYGLAHGMIRQTQNG